MNLEQKGTVAPHSCQHSYSVSIYFDRIRCTINLFGLVNYSVSRLGSVQPLPQSALDNTSTPSVYLRRCTCFLTEVCDLLCQGTLDSTHTPSVYLRQYTYSLNLLWTVHLFLQSTLNSTPTPSVYLGHYTYSISSLGAVHLLPQSRAVHLLPQSTWDTPTPSVYLGHRPTLSRYFRQYTYPSVDLGLWPTLSRYFGQCTYCLSLLGSVSDAVRLLGLIHLVGLMDLFCQSAWASAPTASVFLGK